jgi:hypothetical protein
MRWAGHIACMGTIKYVYKILIGKPERKKPLRRPSHRWEHIRMDLRDTGWEIVDWIHLAQERDQWWALVNMVINPGSIKDENFLTS